MNVEWLRVAQCGMWNVECGMVGKPMKSVECGVLNVECGMVGKPMKNEECGVKLFDIE